jgi:hypothetical protein
MIEHLVGKYAQHAPGKPDPAVFPDLLIIVIQIPLQVLDHGPRQFAYTRTFPDVPEKTRSLDGLWEVDTVSGPDDHGLELALDTGRRVSIPEGKPRPPGGRPGTGQVQNPDGFSQQGIGRVIDVGQRGMGRRLFDSGG